jgi:hypothetical protein
MKDISSMTAYLYFTNTLYNFDANLWPRINSNAYLRTFVNTYGNVGY